MLAIRYFVLLLCLDMLVVFSGVFARNTSYDHHVAEAIRLRFVFWMDLHGEGNILSWYSSAKLLTCGLLLFAVFAHKGAYSALFASGLLVFMSADEGGQIHENVGLLLSIMFPFSINAFSGPSQHLWPYYVGPLAILIFGVLAYFLIRERFFSKRVILIFLLGVSVFLLGALGMEILSHTDTRTNLKLPVDVLEESLELVGSTIVLMASGLAFSENIKVSISRPFALGSAFAMTLLVPFAIFVIAGALISWKSRAEAKLLGPTYQKNWRACLLPINYGVIAEDCTVVPILNGWSMLTYGPYERLKSGRYILDITYISPRDETEVVGKWDMVYEGGAVLLDEQELYGSNRLVRTASFQVSVVDNRVGNAEFRIYARDGRALSFHGYSIRALIDGQSSGRESPRSTENPVFGILHHPH